MAHSVSTMSGADRLAYVQSVSETLFESGRTIDGRLRSLFESETSQFDLEHAFLAHVDVAAGIQRFDIVYGGSGDMVSHTIIPLAESYCRETIMAPEEYLALNSASDAGWAEDPAYERLNLESYIGSTVRVGGELYGTLCYANTEPRPDSFTSAERQLIQFESQLVGILLNQQPSVPGLYTWDPPTGRLDSVLKALCHSARRQVLAALLETPTLSTPSLEGTLEDSDAPISLYHMHLPKLADGGYIEWNQDSGQVARGPQFDTIAPLLAALTDQSAHREL